MSFKDHFSSHAEQYASARPGYPPALFEWLAGQIREPELAWDAGCGNGQAAQELVQYFERVVATDPSAAQLAAAEPHPRIDYRAEPAESPSLAARSVDLVTVAQALHWFELDRFHAAVRRVLRPGGLLAAWCYGLSTVDAGVDEVFMRLYRDILGPWWPPERRHIESGYASLEFPFQRVEAPQFAMQQHWSLGEYLAYLRSWSASQRYQRENDEDPVALVEEQMLAAWGDPAQQRAVNWPLALRVGRCA